jgi:cytosine/adenosine deaminase-related metal-dependent hydrolase
VPFTLEDDTLDALADLAARAAAPLHVHVAEDETDVRDAAARGTTLSARLARMGLARPGSIAAHAVHLAAEDREALAKGGAWIATNARSNMNNAVGLAPARGARVALGTDGIGADMIAEAQAHFFRHAEAKDGLAGEAIARLVGAQRLAAQRFASERAPSASEAFAKTAPGLAPGDPADLAVLSYDPPTPMTDANLAGHVLFGWSSACVRDTLVGGRFVLRQRVLQNLDEAALHARARTAAARLWARMNDVT